MKRLPTFALTILFAVLAACSTLSPKTFNERLATGYLTVTTVRQIGTQLVTAGTLTPDDGENILKQTDNARAGLDIARTLGPDAGGDKLTSTLIILNGLQTYLNTKAK